MKHAISRCLGAASQSLYTARIWHLNPHFDHPGLGPKIMSEKLCPIFVKPPNYVRFFKIMSEKFWDQNATTRGTKQCRGLVHCRFFPHFLHAKMFMSFYWAASGGRQKDKFIDPPPGAEKVKNLLISKWKNPAGGGKFLKNNIFYLKTINETRYLTLSWCCFSEPLHC